MPIPTELQNKESSSGVHNPIIKDDEKKDLPVNLYEETDKAYLSFLQKRLEDARDQKAQAMPEFNGKNYYQDYEENIKIAHTMLPKKLNEDDVIVSAGTIESKLDALLSHVNNMNFEAEVLAYDRENNLVNDLGTALTDTIFMTEQIDGGIVGGDEEKKLLRQRELLVQNSVFVQEEWLRKFERKKKLSEKYDGKFKEWKNWNETLELVFEGPSRTLLHGPNVYLGDITEYFMELQPFVFVAFQQSYDVAKTKYGKFENWKYVNPGAIPEGVTTENQTIYDNKWRLEPIKKNQVEIIIYQDKPNDEFQILINGVAMLPIGFPLSVVCPGGEYNIVKQVFRPIHPKFAYGKSFVSSGSVKELSALVDEMLKLFVLKTRKSVSPPYVNTSGRVISKKVLSPGRISMGFSPDALQKIGDEGQGVTSNEYNILKELQDRIDKSTVSNQFTGQQGKSGTTATEVLELQRQAKLTLGLTIAAAMMLEKKLAYLRLYNIIENWFNPTDTKVVGANDAREYLNSYRKTIREVNIEGEGMGERQVVPFDTTEKLALPDSEVIRGMELQEEKERGKPVRKIFLSPQGLKNAKLRWYIVIVPKEKEGSAFFKVLFREELADILQLMQFGSRPKVDGLEEEFARVWGKSRSKIFSSSGVSPDLAGVSPAVGGDIKGRGNQAGVPKMGDMASAGMAGISG